MTENEISAFINTWIDLRAPGKRNKLLERVVNILGKHLLAAHM